MPDGALTPLSILDLSEEIAGPFCARLLAGYGADVIKVECPHGDPTRRWGPFVGGLPDPERSAPFLWLNAGKRGLVLDLANPSGRERLLALVARADVVIESGTPGRLASLGCDYEAMRAANPRVVLVSITPFGQTGPYCDFAAPEIVLAALAGLMHLTGDPGAPPLVGAPAVTQYTAALCAYVATLAALFQRGTDGPGQHIDISIHECALDNIEVALIEHDRLGTAAKRTGDQHTLVPWQLYPCRDGHVAIIGGPVRRWRAAAPLFESPPLVSEEFLHIADRMRRRDEVAALLRPWLDRHGKEEIFHAGQKGGLAFGFLATLDEVLASPQHRARGFFQTVHHPVAGPQTYCGAPFRLARSPWRPGRAPLVDEHHGAVFEAVPEPPAERPDHHAQLTTPSLADVRVLDLTHDWAGPHAARLLADLGADVIKIEYPRRLDGMRGGRVAERAFDRHPRFHQLHRNKRSVTLDLADPRDADLFRELVRHADVVVENSRPGVLERLRIGYEQLRELNPEIILVSMPAFGGGGPYSAYAGYGGSLEALSGVQSLTTYGDGGPPRRIKEMDVTNGVVGACAILTALLHHRRTGNGGWVECAQHEAATTTLIGERLLARAAGTVPASVGNRHGEHAPHGCYRCNGTDAWVVLAIRSDKEWRLLCDVMEDPGLLADARFASAAGRIRDQDLLDAAVEAWTITRSHEQVMYSLQQVGIAAGAVQTIPELWRDAHLVARGYFVEAADGSGRYPRSPIRIAGMPATVRRRGPDLGQDSAAVFCELLGRANAPAEAPAEHEIGTAFDAC